MYTRKDCQHEESADNDGDDEYEDGGNNQLEEETTNDENVMHQRPKRNIPKVDYELFHKKGRKK